MTKRVCDTCCWYSVFECQLEPVVARKKPQDRCRHHSFTTGWLGEDELPEDELPLPNIDRSLYEGWKNPESKSPSDLDAKVKALSERCKEARLILTETRHLLDGWGREADLWLAGEDE